MRHLFVMTPERYQKIKLIFHDAMEREPRERDSFLDQACAGDADLRGQVERLLASQNEATGFIEKLAEDISLTLHEDDGAAPVAGRVIGPYKVLREIGRGGMGTVLLATRDDDEFHKRVAIKLIKRGMDTDFIVRRFRNERQILANLDHPNIARLLDGGSTADGLPYLVMDFIEGQPIDDYCDNNRLSLAERLKLFLRVCSAVHYAHQNLVIHRDIKPSNILVTSDGTPKLLDFGIAKLLDTDSFSHTVEMTATAMRLMTPEYASPEQVKGGPITTASDVYALGVVLYELLTGHRPYRLKSRYPHEITEAVCAQEPGRPSTAISRTEEVVMGQDQRPQIITPESVGRARDEQPLKLKRRLAGDLDNIILMALRKEPARRYKSVEEFAADIRRHLDGLPVIARRDTLLYRGAKFIKRNKAAVLAAAAAALVVLLIVVSLRLLSPIDTRVESLAVLPLVNVGDDPNIEYLADGITDTLIGNLSTLPGLEVKSRSSVFRYKSPGHDPLEAARQLDVNAVLTGTISQRGDGITIAAELIDARNNRRLWGAQYNRKLDDIIFVQEEISRKVSESLRSKNETGERPSAKLHTENSEAYQLYLKGRFFWNKRTADALNRSIEYYKEAVATDPQYALAYSGMADSYSILGFIGRPADMMPRAKEAALRALEIDDSLAEAHTSLARVAALYDWDWPTAEREYRRSIELNPNYATAHLWYADYLMQTGRIDEGIDQIRLAQKLDPLSLIVNTNLAIALYFARRYDEGIEQCRRAIEMDRNVVAGHNVMGWCYERKAMHAEAVAEFKNALSLGGEAIVKASLGYTYATSGRRAEALKTLEELKAQSNERYVSPYCMVLIHTALGERDEAFRWLDRACEERALWLVGLKMDPRLDPLRSDQRYSAVLARMGLAQL